MLFPHGLGTPFVLVEEDAPFAARGVGLAPPLLLRLCMLVELSDHCRLLPPLKVLCMQPLALRQTLLAGGQPAAHLRKGAVLDDVVDAPRQVRLTLLFAVNGPRRLFPQIQLRIIDAAGSWRLRREEVATLEHLLYRGGELPRALVLARLARLRVRCGHAHLVSLEDLHCKRLVLELAVARELGEEPRHERAHPIGGWHGGDATKLGEDFGEALESHRAHLSRVVVRERARERLQGARLFNAAERRACDELLHQDGLELVDRAALYKGRARGLAIGR